MLATELGAGPSRTTGAAASTVPLVLLGASGYVGGELLRLLAFHPVLRLAAAASGSNAGTPIAGVFPHLAAAYPRTAFAPSVEPAELLALGDADVPLAVVSALPHGRSAPALAALLDAAEAAGRELAVVDLAADFRLPAERYAEVYGHPHPAPERLAQFYCGLPDLCAARPARPVAHPGCFTTAVTLAAWPLVALGLVEGDLVASAVTGSTGSGREPVAGTHHPERHGDLRAYSPLGHRHRAEMEALLERAARTRGDGKPNAVAKEAPEVSAGASATGPAVLFVPHSGPFARGIHATVVGRLRAPIAADELAARVGAIYAGSPFVAVGTAPPRLKDVVGTNRAHLGIATRGREVVVLSVIDNLVKGAAGGGVQWLNRLLGLPDDCGLVLPGLGWT